MQTCKKHEGLPLLYISQSKKLLCKSCKKALSLAEQSHVLRLSVLADDEQAESDRLAHDCEQLCRTKPVNYIRAIDSLLAKLSGIQADQELLDRLSGCVTECLLEDVAKFKEVFQELKGLAEDGDELRLVDEVRRHNSTVRKASVREDYLRVIESGRARLELQQELKVVKKRMDFVQRLAMGKTSSLAALHMKMADFPQRYSQLLEQYLTADLVSGPLRPSDSPDSEAQVGISGKRQHKEADEDSSEENAVGARRAGLEAREATRLLCRKKVEGEGRDEESQEDAREGTKADQDKAASKVKELGRSYVAKGSTREKFDVDEGHTSEADRELGQESQAPTHPANASSLPATVSGTATGAVLTKTTVKAKARAMEPAKVKVKPLSLAEMWRPRQKTAAASADADADPEADPEAGADRGREIEMSAGASGKEEMQKEATAEEAAKEGRRTNRLATGTEQLSKVSEESLLRFTCANSKETKVRDAETARSIKAVLDGGDEREAKVEKLVALLGTHSDLHKLQFEKVDMSNSSQGNAAVVAALLRRVASVPKLKFKDIITSTSSMPVVLGAVARVRELQKLSLEGVTLESAAELREIVRESRGLTVLSLSHCTLSFTYDTQNRDLARLLERNGTLKALKIIKCNLLDTDMEDLRDGLLHNRSLTKLDLSENSITLEGMKHILHSCKTNHTLSTLVLNRTFATLDGIDPEIIHMLDNRPQPLNAYVD